MSTVARMHLPRQLIGGGHHFDDMDHLTACRAQEHHVAIGGTLLPRERLCNQVEDGCLSHLPPDRRHH
jgi:hypothetical protein